MLIQLQPPNTYSKYHITFTKTELNAILAVYSFQVSKGQWRDYAIDFTKTMAMFSIYRHAHETPFASVVKLPANTSTGFVFEVFLERKRLSRSSDLARALDALKETLN